jgi:hypothetical protein
MGIDLGFGSSFGIVIVKFSDGVIEVQYADEFEPPRYEEMINKLPTCIINLSILRTYSSMLVLRN